MLQNYVTDVGYTYWAVKYNTAQSMIIPTTTNQPVLTVLQTYLPILYSQAFSDVNSCELPQKIKTRNVEIELQNGTKYKFDIPFNSSDTNWNVLLTQLNGAAIKSWVITGEKIPGYKLPLLLTLVP
jgi:hypothetical protein